MTPVERENRKVAVSEIQDLSMDNLELMALVGHIVVCTLAHQGVALDFSGTLKEDEINEVYRICNRISSKVSSNASKN